MTSENESSMGDWQVIDRSDNMYMLELHEGRVIASVNAVNVVRPTLEIKVLLADSADGNDVYNDGGGTERKGPARKVRLTR